MIFIRFLSTIDFIYMGIGGFFMPKKFNAGCQRPEIKKDKVEESKPEENKTIQKEELNMIKVGKPAPDFTIPAFHKGEFVNLSLSEFKGKWVLLCFYPGDFTFV